MVFDLNVSKVMEIMSSYVLRLNVDDQRVFLTFIIFHNNDHTFCYKYLLANIFRAWQLIYKIIVK